MCGEQEAGPWAHPLLGGFRVTAPRAGMPQVHGAVPPMPPELATPVAPSEPRVDASGNVLAIGEVLGATFEVRSLLGAGGMGQVYEAHDRLLNRKVAIKVPWPHLRGSVLREARGLAALRHPSMVTVHGIGAHRGFEYAVMERLYGESLAGQIVRRQNKTPAFEIDETIEILAGAADGLAVVHNAGIAHRDVKPDNIMLAPGNRVVLMDFGIFRPESDRSTQREIAGSPWYLAPEIIGGDARPGDLYLADTYALGVVAFELLAGEVPYAHDNVRKVLHDHLVAPVPDVSSRRPDTPAALASLVRELLAKEPRERPPTMEAVVWRLRNIRRHRLPAAAGLSVVIAEDNPSSAIVMRSLIEEVAPEARVRIARDGLHAVELARRSAPHLLVVDLRMPKMSGLEVCLALRDTPVAEQTTVLVVSAHAEPGDLELLHRLGFSRFLKKGRELADGLPVLLAELARRGK